MTIQGCQWKSIDGIQKRINGRTSESDRATKVHRSTTEVTRRDLRAEPSNVTAPNLSGPAGTRSGEGALVRGIGPDGIVF